MIYSANCKEWCPKCDSTNIIYGSIEIGDNVIYYPGECQDCGCEFKEYYDYVETEWEE